MEPNQQVATSLGNTSQSRGAAAYITGIPLGSVETWHQAARYGKATAAFTHRGRSAIYFPDPLDSFAFATEVLSNPNMPTFLSIVMQTRTEFNDGIQRLKNIPGGGPRHEFG